MEVISVDTCSVAVWQFCSLGGVAALVGTLG